MKEFLEKLGFYQFRGCGCNGGEYQYRKENMIGIVIKLKKRNNSYEIKRSGQVINRGSANQLEAEYNRIFNDKTPTAHLRVA